MKHPIRATLAAGLIFAANIVAAQESPRIVAVNYPLQYFAERLIGDAAQVVFPVPADVDPSFWRPAIADISMIQSSDLILLNGAAFATWVDRVSLPRSKIVNTSSSIEDQFIRTESITHSHGDGGEHSHEGLASYVWLDPTLAMAQAQAVAAAITSKGLAPTEDVTARLNTLRSDLDAMDARAREALVELQNVTLIATHPRYEYFARRYDLTIKSLEWEAGAMPGDDQIAELRTLVSDTQAKVMIWEATPPAEAFEITRELGLNNIVFAPLAHAVDGSDFIEVYTDAVLEMSGATTR